MPFLYEKQMGQLILKNSKNAALKKLQDDCKSTTEKLHKQPNLRHNGAYSFPDEWAENLAKVLLLTAKDPDRMKLTKVFDALKKQGVVGETTTDSAAKYVDNWMQVSGNAQTVYGIVTEELAHAHELGLDVRKVEVIGKIFKLAAKLFSEGAYSGFAQKEGKR